MTKKLYHPSLNEVDVLLEMEHHNKRFYLVSKLSKYIQHNGDKKLVAANSWEIRNKKCVLHHWVLWGNTNNPDLMGTIHLTSPKGYPMRKTRVVNELFEIMKASEKLTFLK